MTVQIPICSSVLLNRCWMWIWWSCKRNVCDWDSTNRQYKWRVWGEWDFWGEWDSSLSLRGVSRFVVTMLKGERNLQWCQNDGLGRIKWTTHMRTNDKLTIERQSPTPPKETWDSDRCSSIGTYRVAPSLSWKENHKIWSKIIESVKRKYWIDTL